MTKKKKKDDTERKKISKKEAEEVVKKSAQKITEKDLELVLEKSEEIKKKFESAGPLGRFVEDCKLLMSVTKDYWKRRYKDIPFWSIAAIVAALLYVFNPFDLIPDAIPVIG